MVDAKTGAVRLASKLSGPIVPVYIPRRKARLLAHRHRHRRAVHGRGAQPRRVRGTGRRRSWSAYMSSGTVRAHEGNYSGEERRLLLRRLPQRQDGRGHAARAGPASASARLSTTTTSSSRLAARGLRVIASPEEAGRASACSYARTGSPSPRRRRCVERRGDNRRNLPQCRADPPPRAEAAAAGQRGLVIGRADHPEVRAICGRCDGATVRRNAQELEILLSERPNLRSEAAHSCGPDDPDGGQSKRM